MRRVIALASTALAACAVTVALAAPASAHDNAVSLSAVCQENGQYLVTVTTVNDFEEAETVTFSGSFTGTADIGPLGTDVSTFTVPGSSTSVTVTVVGIWEPDGFTESSSATIPLAGTCTAPTTPPTTPPAVEGTVVVRGQAVAAVPVQAQPTVTG